MDSYVFYSTLNFLFPSIKLLCFVFPSHAVQALAHIAHLGCRPQSAILCWSQTNPFLLGKYQAVYLFQVNRNQYGKEVKAFPSNLKAIFAGCRVLGWEFPTFSICWSPLFPWEVICHSHCCSVVVFGSWAGFELVVALVHLAGPWDPSVWRVRSVFAFHSGLQLLALLSNDCLWCCRKINWWTWWEFRFSFL